jgi:hypothetical protein
MATLVMLSADSVSNHLVALPGCHDAGMYVVIYLDIYSINFETGFVIISLM